MRTEYRERIPKLALDQLFELFNRKIRFHHSTWL